ncbi:hypothetical protein KI387_044235 [Taxus chinensis]|uniref:Reverse transcriptase domain-containing protein n=1 Tax=Taxus chinensis TaxID=29808 RepID=A0AA38CAB7_TAXCH|nr:hypothetical protein KI387_044235 [Taxus chinensis]
MDNLLKLVTSSEFLSTLDGFSGSNQVVVKELERIKTTFTTPWGTYVYVKMPFGLMNVGATFQSAMDVAFAGYINYFIVVYQDDVTVFSRKINDHFRHLERMLVRCRVYVISLNPNKCHFGVQMAKLLGHIVLKEGVMIDSKRVESINKVPILRNKKGVQFFFGKINIIRIFLFNFFELTIPITSILKKDQVIKWEEASIQDFNGIKEALKHAPILEAPNYKKFFQMFSFSSENTIASILLRKDDEGAEREIAFFSKELQGGEFKYTFIEKKEFSLVKATKFFRPYILSSKVVSYVPHTMVKDILLEMEVSRKRCRWVNQLQEYDMDIQTMKLIIGLGLAKLMGERNLQTIEVNEVEGEMMDVLENW